jgi:hypothetical protein
LENSTNLWFDLLPALTEIRLLSAREKGIKIDVPSAYMTLVSLHKKNLISHKTLTGVTFEVFYR